MKKFLILILLLTACSIEQTQTLNVYLLDEHFWAYENQKPMWYTLKYFYGNQIKSKTVFANTHCVQVEVLKGKTCIFVAYPIGTLTPIGGGYTPGDSEKIYLHSKEGKLAELLIDATDINSKLVSNLNFKRLFNEVGYIFDEQELLVDILNGEYSSSKKYKTKEFKVELENIPKGKYLPEYEYYPTFEKNEGESKISINLHPGVYRFINCSTHIYLLVRVDQNGGCEVRSYKPIIY